MTVVAVLALAFTAPSAMHRIDQPRTASYTVDMVVHGRWFLPLDVIGHPATKPPLVNWLCAPLIAMGWHTQAAFWLPPACFTLIGLGLTVGMAWWLFAGGVMAPYDAADRRAAVALAAAAGLCAMASGRGVMLWTYVRPDTLLLPLLVLAWWLATDLLHRAAMLDRRADGPARCETHSDADADADSEAKASRQLPPRLRFAFWFVLGLIALTKAIPIVFPLLYVLLGAKLMHGRWSPARRLGWAWGLPMALAMFALWLVPAYLSDPDYFRRGLLGVETLGRISGVQGIYGAEHHTSAGPWDLLLTMHVIPMWFVERLATVSILAIVAVVVIGVEYRRAAVARRACGGENGTAPAITTQNAHDTEPTPWRRHPMTPAILWLLIVLGLPMLSAGKAAQYVLPALAPASILAAYAVHRLVKHNRHALRFATAALAAAAVGFALYPHVGGYHARNPTGRNLVRFAAQADAWVDQRLDDHRKAGIPHGDPADGVVFVATGYNTLQALMGRNQAGPATTEPWDAAVAAIAPLPLAPDLTPVLVSGPVTLSFDEHTTRLGLYDTRDIPADHPLRCERRIDAGPFASQGDAPGDQTRQTPARVPRTLASVKPQ